MTRPRWRLALLGTILLGWSGVTILAASHYVATHVGLAGNEGYERNWDFQLAMFALTRLPFLLGGLFGALLWLRRIHGGKG